MNKISNNNNFSNETETSNFAKPRLCAVNFTEFCEKAKTMEEIQHALKFYQQPFDIWCVATFFENWELVENDEKYRKGKYLKNAHSNGKWSTTITINDDAEYTFAENDNTWQYLPRTWSEFISDILRYEDFDLVLSDLGYAQIYGT